MISLFAAGGGGTAAVLVDEAAARIWAQMLVHLAETGRRVRVNDLWIAAVAAANGLPVVTQDDDFEPVRGVAGLAVIKVSARRQHDRGGLRPVPAREPAADGRALPSPTR
jgi:hypothetical protein